ncbi:hypothetical protein D4764_11G0008060, partial [Takifugu flavidus]
MSSVERGFLFTQEITAFLPAVLFLSDCGRAAEGSTPGMLHLSQQKPNLAISNELQILL